KNKLKISQFWEHFDLTRKLEAKQSVAQVSIQINALKVLDVSAAHQANELIKRTCPVLSGLNCSQNCDDGNIDHGDDDLTKMNSVNLKKRKAYTAFDEKLDDLHNDENLNVDQFDNSYSSSDVSFASSHIGEDFLLFDNDEKIKIDLTEIAKQLEQEPLNEWVVEGIRVTQKFREYQKKVLYKANKEGLTWDDTYEVLGLSSILVLSWPCPYPMFTTEEWILITKTNPYALTEPVFPPEISTSLNNAVCKHWNGEDVYIYPGDSAL
ncbi:25989_t:CDS:2, partial [Racocetra persica]